MPERTSQWRVWPVLACALLPGLALAQTYADRNLSIPPVGGNGAQRPIVIVSPVVPSGPSPLVPQVHGNGPAGAYASDEPGPDIRARNADYVTQFKVVGQVPPGATISKVSWRYTLASKPAGFEARLCWQDAGLCWDVSDANAGSTDFFNGRDATRPFQLHYSLRGTARTGEAPIKGEVNQVIVTFATPG
ncbi:flagellar protein FlhE [Herbaspirillum rubrisubalbicans]|uniref:flagellar protein FlhE n=1 Tax=Herbaspirillum rubrisubalbicans TaxID=80842 RepID=UPI00073ADE92|nr:flagellar protein FlhE [Herbaspirillum rubrisubalbicans]ALU89225.1 Flagellar protein FlhE [Herbaspirillum rubrisubalbicans M1]